MCVSIDQAGGDESATAVVLVGHRVDQHARLRAFVAAPRDAVADQLRVVAITERIPPDGVVLAPPLDGHLQATLRDALLALHQREAGRAALKSLLSAERLAPATGDVVRLIARSSAVLASRA